MIFCLACCTRAIRKVSLREIRLPFLPKCLENCDHLWHVIESRDWLLRSDAARSCPVLDMFSGDARLWCSLGLIISARPALAFVSAGDDFQQNCFQPTKLWHLNHVLTRASTFAHVCEQRFYDAFVNRSWALARCCFLRFQLRSAMVFVAGETSARGPWCMRSIDWEKNTFALLATLYGKLRLLRYNARYGHW